MVRNGLGLHADHLSDNELVTLGKLLLVFECVYCVTVGSIKLSILSMYYRIFVDLQFHIATFVLLGTTIAWVIAIVFVSIFQCTPIARASDKSITGHCIDLKGSFIGNALPNILTDIAIVSLPIRRVWKLQASTAQRLSIILTFLTSSFVVFASAYRFSTLFEFQPTDLSWILSRANMWCIVEIALGVVSACLPTLRPLLRFASSSYDSTKSSNPYACGHGGTDDRIPIKHRERITGRTQFCMGKSAFRQNTFSPSSQSLTRQDSDEVRLDDIGISRSSTMGSDDLQLSNQCR
ncbi:hypothetical protein BDV33DRAFT_185619 [Aspergillus novoparasiticus]|uniref:Rhodopsin domain-containing protein n=1 Tax=Aspergillus novoparasiticus TaxID=986946 RepID=A0A5N6E893_9EURO|nr:hypothetical protein BDV33DRAFT_185619 [Aspergillus novoparasiticus]